MTVNCYIYRCSAKENMYIYLAEEKDFDCLDEKLKRALGELTFTMHLDLSEETKLVIEDPKKVMSNLKTQKFHLQMPPQTTVEAMLGKLSK